MRGEPGRTPRRTGSPRPTAASPDSTALIAAGARLAGARPVPPGDPSAGGRSVVSSGEKPVEAVENQVEADLELVAVGVAGLQDVAGGHLHEVRVLTGGHLTGDLPGNLCRFVLGAGRQTGLLQREPVDVAV